MILFCFRFSVVLFGSPGIPNCNALRCICWVLVFASIFLTATIHWLVRGLSCEPNKQLYALYRFRNWERGWRRKIYQSPKKLVTDRLKAVVLFGVRVSVTFHLVCLLYSSSVLVSECHLFGKSCSLGLPSVLFVFCSYFPFWFWGSGFDSDCTRSWLLLTRLSYEIVLIHGVHRRMFFFFLANNFSEFFVYFCDIWPSAWCGGYISPSLLA